MIAVEKTDQHKQQQQEQQNAHVGTHKRKQSEIINTRTNNKSTTQAPNSNNNSKNKENVNKNTVREKIRIIDEAYKKWTRESDNIERERAKKVEMIKSSWRDGNKLTKEK